MGMAGVVAICACLAVLLLPAAALIFLYKFWWYPLHIQKLLNSQGIKGPSYRFLHGTNKEALEMRKQASNTPMDLSHDIFPKTQPHFYTWIQLYGGVFLNWFGPQPQIVVTDPEMIREILINKQATYPKPKPRFYFKKLLGEGIVMTDGEKWMKLRKLSNHSFHGESLKDMFPAMVTSVECMLEEWKQYAGREIEVSRHFRFLTSEVISRTAFGSSYLEGRAIFDLLTKLCALISNNLYSIRKFVRTENETEADRMEKLLHDMIMKIVKKREDELATGKASGLGDDFLGSLLKGHNTNDKKNQISLQEIIDECKTFYFAGQETTSSLLCWSALLLAINTDWQERARQEVLEIFGQENPTIDGVLRLKTINMIIYETLRLYSPIIAITRRIASKVKLGKYELPANIDLYILPQAVHRNPDIWGHDAHLFKPERFAEGLVKATDGNPTAFLGFGFGPRMCVGNNFAINEAKIALSMILQRYKLALSPTYVHAPHIVLTAQPKHGVQLLLHSLSSI